MAFSFYQLFILLSTLTAAVISSDDIFDSVNLLAGTSNSYSVSTGGSMPIMARPFGFNHWSVQTEADSSGSRYFNPSSNDFYGVRCTHQPSVWIQDYGYFLVTALISSQEFDSTSTKMAFSPLYTIYKPYYFKSSTLVPSFQASAMGGVTIEMTPTNHAAYFRFSFPPKMNSRVLVRIMDGQLADTPVVINNGTFSTITHVNSGGVPKNFSMFVHGVATSTVRIVNLHGSIALDYDNRNSAKRKLIELRVATSFISDAQAMRNLAKELPPDRSFDSVVKDGEDIWLKRLGYVKIDQSRQSVNFLRTFYTNYYRTLLFPRLLTEYDEEGKAVHYSPYTGGTHSGELTTDSGFWDAYRTVYFWLSLSAPDILDRLLEGWVNAYKEAGWLPTWASPGQRGSMVGTMGDVVLAWAIVANKSSHLADDMYAAIRKDAFEEGKDGFGREALKEYSQNGYIPVGSASEVVSRTLNYALADAAIANAANKLGHSSDAHELSLRAHNAIEKTFNSETKLFEARDNNGFVKGVSPVSWSGEYFTEASGLQYRFYAPFDIDFLVTKYGGKEALCSYVNKHFTEQESPVFVTDERGVFHEETELALITEGFGQYGQNNQPSHHVLGVALAAGCFETADKYMRKVLRELYTPNGWPGDDDNGEMSAWFMLNALGLYMIDFGKDEVLLFSPMVKGGYELPLPGLDKPLSVHNNGSYDDAYVCEVQWFPDGALSDKSKTSPRRYKHAVNLRSGRALQELHYGVHEELMSDPAPLVDQSGSTALSNRRVARSVLAKGGRLNFVTASKPC